MRRFYFKIAATFSVILILFGLVVAFVTTQASADVVHEAIQTTNRDLASILAEDFQPMLKESFSQQEIEEKLTEMSGKNPQFDFYLLGSDGAIKSVIPASKEKVSLKKGLVDTQPLDNFIAGKPLPILSNDPLNPDQKKPFSVTNVSIMGSQGCYLYVVLEGDQFSRATAMISNSYITRSSLIIIGIALMIGLVVGLFLFSNLSRRLEKIKNTVTKFERGQLTERIDVDGKDELADLSVCFNRMADTLVENMDEVQKADKMRRELVANVSHDLRSPLASIQGYLETIEMKGESITKKELRSYFKTVLGNTQKLNRMIDDLFELTKLDTDHIRPNLENISMAELVQDLVQQLKPIAQKKGVKLIAKFPGNPNALIKADISMMSRAITNLIDNAITHTPKGGEVTVLSIQKGKDIVLEVTDTGVGIAEADLPHIFERFYQVDKSRTVNNGAGLGLVIAQKIFNLHGAEITVQSSINQGTTFRVNLSSSI
ncbi:MAG: HAMP domain-containing sensor histidine kinase [Balneolaceae bacterium]